MIRPLIIIVFGIECETEHLGDGRKKLAVPPVGDFGYDAAVSKLVLFGHARLAHFERGDAVLRRRELERDGRRNAVVPIDKAPRLHYLGIGNLREQLTGPSNTGLSMSTPRTSSNFTLHGKRSYNFLELAIERTAKQGEFASNIGITGGGCLRIGLHHARIGECGKKLGVQWACGE